MQEDVRRWTLGLLMLFAASMGIPSWAAARPNFVLILIDDLGYNDVGVYGSTFHQTPHIDRLAAEGVRFSNGYAAAPVCSPTRASILTGRAPARLHLTNFIPGGESPPDSPIAPPEDYVRGLPTEEITIAERLESEGYATGMIGKWHLGGGRGQGPGSQGFGFTQHDGFSMMVRYWVPPLVFGRHIGAYPPDLVSEAAVRFIEQNADRPFFLYLAHNSVHVPIQAKAESVRRYEARLEQLRPPPGGQRNPHYAAMVEGVDESVGRIMEALQRLRIEDRTVVILLSDNGGLTVAEPLGPWTFPHTPATTLAPLRGGKGYLYEGGLRIPWIVKWPGVTSKGAVCDEVVITHDLYPTISEMAGVRAHPERPLDGRSLVSLLHDEGASLERDSVFWHYPHFSNQGGRPGGVIRAGPFKLIERYEDGSVELYDLSTDPGESENLAERLPGKASELRGRLSRWRDRVGAQMPIPNPEFTPAATRSP